MEPSREGVDKMFDRIARRYDLLNHILSFGLDFYWRARVAHLLPRRSGLEVLDVATGTGDLLFEIAKRRSLARGVGIDVSEGMLAIARRKAGNRHLEFHQGDALALPFPDANFDAVTIAFGIRNVLDVPRALREMRRALKPGGDLLVLEFSKPIWFVRPFHLFYLRHILPRIGGALTGDPAAYRYLNQTIETFPSGDAFLALMREAGFEQTRAHPLSLGIVSIYHGRA